MKIAIIEIGKTRQKFLLDAEREYLKRLIPFARISVITIKDQGEAVSESQKTLLREKEAKIIEQKIPEDSFVIALDEKGTQFSSTKLSDFIKEKRDKSIPLCFVIGGVYGLSDTVKNKADILLSFSKFTFTHEMIRTLLLEQIYRSFTIINGKKYHY
jgi:23S rRNA (pseudouridine1915-N3)-methyltransferase